MHLLYNISSSLDLEIAYCLLILQKNKLSIKDMLYIKNSNNTTYANHNNIYEKLLINEDDIKRLKILKHFVEKTECFENSTCEQRDNLIKSFDIKIDYKKLDTQLEQKPTEHIVKRNKI